MRKEAQNLMPGLGGHAVEEASAKVKVGPADELLLQASGAAAPAPASSPGASAAAGTMASDASPSAAPSPDKIGVPVGFGDMGTGSDGFKP